MIYPFEISHMPLDTHMKCASVQTRMDRGSQGDSRSVHAHFKKRARSGLNDLNKSVHGSQSVHAHLRIARKPAWMLGLHTCTLSPGGMEEIFNFQMVNGGHPEVSSWA
jgi:hypothetical protein